MYAGEIVEIGPTQAVFEAPMHPYTIGLIGTARALQNGAERLPEIAGELPSLSEARAGCAFAPRCPSRRAECTARPIGLARIVAQLPVPASQVRCLLFAGA
jgi:oligopeptide/dipeptide ABC transporter ATP-binding protein